MICDKHGGNIASMVSPDVAKQVVDCYINKDQLKKIIFLDDDKKEYRYFVDADFYNKIQIEFNLDLSSPITSDELMFEIDLELVPVCPKCLHELID